MKIHKFNLATPKKYTKDGEEKTTWNRVGTLTIFEKDNGEVSRLVEIPAIGLEAQAFKAEEKKEGSY